MNFTWLSEDLIRQHATNTSYERGLAYYQSGAVRSVVKRGRHIHAEVEGSQVVPYQVDIFFDENGVTDARCTCPYDWGGWCKHIVATLLTCLHHPEQVEERPTVAEMLADLGREELQTILIYLGEQYPDMVDAIETEIERLRAHTASPPSEQPRSKRKTSVDGGAFRRRVVGILHSLDAMRPSEAYWHVNEVVNEIHRLLNHAWEFIEAGDGNNALLILEAITDEYVKGWFNLDDSDGEASSFFYELGPAWTEALLSADLTPEERREWADKLAKWQNEIEDYGIDPVFDAAIAAALQGWDDPRLRNVLNGGEVRIWEGEPPPFADELITARLEVLARQKRYDEYLNLAQAAGKTLSYLTMLVQLGKVQEAFEEGMRRLTAVGEALNLAQALQEQGAQEEAIRLAEHGLELAGQGYTKASLARWLRDTARRAGKRELALKAAIIAVHEAPNLKDYFAVKELAADRWEEIRAKLLEHLSQISYPIEGKVEIFLHEGLIDDAIATVGGSYDYDLIEKVVNAAIPTRPEWAIQTSRKQAEAIMNAGKAKYYNRAIQWLEKARSAYIAAGREAEWQKYIESLLQRHARKYKLVPMLERLK